MQNAVIMTVTALVLRTIGIFFRIYLSNCIGAEGMGLYQLVFSVYVLVSTFASAGITTAVTRLITDELVCGTSKSIKRILSRAVTISVLCGLLSAVIIFAAANPLGKLIVKDIRAIPSLKMLGISLPFMGATACLRGYFMARRKTVCPSLGQITEQLARIAFISLFLWIFKGKDIAYTCLAVILGDSFAEIVSCAFLSVGYLLDSRHLKSLISPQNTCQTAKHSIVYRLAAIAVPITAGRYLSSALRTVENILVPQKLTAFHHSPERALSEFGMLKGMALPLLFFPSSFLSSISTLLIPELSEAHTLQQKSKVCHAVSKTLQLTLLSSILLSGLFTMYAYELGVMLYHSHDVGFLMRVLSPLMPIMYLESIVDGMLKGLNQQIHSLWYSVLDSGSRIVMIIYIIPARGMGGFLFIMVISNLLTSLLNLNRLLRVTDVRMEWGNWVIKPTLAIVLSAAITTLISRYMPFVSLHILRILIGGSITVILYCIFAFLLGALSVAELRRQKEKRVCKTPAE